LTPRRAHTGEEERSGTCKRHNKESKGKMRMNLVYQDAVNIGGGGLGCGCRIK
jgi:hypothetical protein